MDPLSALREFVSSGRLQEVVTVGDRIQFGDKYSYPKSISTTCKSQQGKGAYYPLDAVTYWLHFEQQNPTLKQGEYISSAIKAHVTRITGVDIKDLRDYLHGTTQSSKYVQEPEINFAGLPADDEDEDTRALRAKRQKLDDVADGIDQDGADILQHALATERKLRDRNSQLSVPNKSFARVRAICEQQLQQMSGAMQRSTPSRPPGSAAKPANLIKPSGRLEREVAPDLGLAGAAQLGIQVTSHPRPASSQPAAAQQSTSSRQTSAASQRSHPQPSTSGRPERQLPGAPPQKPRQPHHKLTPIILVPPGETATITMWNAQTFLEQGQYTSVEASRHDKGAKGEAKESKSRIHRTIGRNRPIRYEITDRAPSDKAGWDRVVALFCLGKAWQFKSYPKQLFPGCDKGDTVALFSNVLGVYLHMSDEEVPGDVKKWNVKILRLNRHNRHTDMAEAGHFYSELDKFMNTHAKKATGLAF